MVVASKKRIAGLLPLGLAALVVPGCFDGSAKFVRTAADPGPPSPHSAALVAVLPPGTAVAYSVQTGIIEGESALEGALSDDQSRDALAEILKVAAMHGCDAIVPTPVEKRLVASSPQGGPVYRWYQSAACFVRLPGGSGQPKP